MTAVLQFRLSPPVLRACREQIWTEVEMLSGIPGLAQAVGECLAAEAAELPLSLCQYRWLITFIRTSLCHGVLSTLDKQTWLQFVRDELLDQGYAKDSGRYQLVYQALGLAWNFMPSRPSETDDAVEDQVGGGA